MRSLLLPLLISTLATSLGACRTSKASTPAASTPQTIVEKREEPASQPAYLPRALRKNRPQAASAPAPANRDCARALAIYRCVFNRMPTVPGGTLARLERTFAKMSARQRARFCPMALHALRRSFANKPQFASCL